MSKSVLIINTPKNCMDCPLAEFNPECELCYGAGKNLDIMFANKKPDWCPLREITRKSPTKLPLMADMPMEYTDYEKGWNDCIKKILGG